MKIQNITKTIKGNTILNDISLEFNNTGLVFLCGTSGAGKTTLFNIMSGIDNEYEGTVIYDDTSLSREWHRKNTSGIIFQDYNLINSLNVRDNILLGIEISGMAYNEEEYNKIISLLGIANLQDRKIFALSGGERQRVAIARALLRNDKIIFADEPSGNLDKENTRILFDYLKTLSKDRLFLVVTHDLTIADNYGDRVIHIDDGKIIEDNITSYNKNAPLEINHSESSKSPWILKYSLKSFLARKKKTLSIIILSMLVMISLLFITGFLQATDDMVNEMDSTILENDKIKIHNIDEALDYFPVNEPLLNKLKQLDNVKYADSYYSEEIYLNCDNVAQEGYKLSYNIYDNSDFYISRYTEIYGTFPQSKYEIMIDSYVANYLFNSTDCIGETIYLSTDNLFITEVKITAIKKHSSSYIGEVYISKELSYDIFKPNLCNIIYCLNPNSEYIVEPVINMGKIYDNEPIIYGYAPNAENEIVINTASVNTILYLLNGTTTLYSKSDILNGSVNSQIDNLIFGNNISLRLALTGLVIGDYKIVGICESENDYAGILFSNKLFQNNVPCNIANIYLEEVNESKTTKTKEDVEGLGLIFESVSSERTAVVQSKMSLLTLGIIAITILLIILTGLMLHFFMKMSINERRYEMGVLLSLGCNKRNIISILLCEQLILSFIIIFISSIITLVVAISDVSSKLIVDNVSVYNFKMWHFAIVTLYTIASTIIFSLLDIIKVSRKNIVELIKGKYELG